MKKDFNQVYVSNVLEKYFGLNFRNRWNLSKYSDVYSPSVFLGLYEQRDLEIIVKHKGEKILIWGGGDMKTSTLKFISNIQPQHKINTWAYPGDFSDTLSLHNIRHKELYIPLKDYSNFKPVTLGKNIYLYKGVNGNRPDYFKWNEIIDPLIKVFGQDRIIFTNNLPMNELIEKVYKNCFVYIKPTPKGGCTTMFELGHMGIRTIGKNHKDLNIFSHYESVQQLIDLVKQESQYIGIIREDISESIKKSFIGEEWLTLEFWNN
jgi:hypothetical protein